MPFDIEKIQKLLLDESSELIELSEKMVTASNSFLKFVSECNGTIKEFSDIRSLEPQIREIASKTNKLFTEIAGEYSKYMENCLTQLVLHSKVIKKIAEGETE